MPINFYIRTLLCVLIGPSLAWAYVPEPMQVRSQGVSQLFRMNPPVFGSRLQHQYSLQVSRTYANLWGHEKRFRIDMEVIDDQLRSGFRLLPALRFDLGLSQRRFGSTGTDAMAIGFHNAFGLPQDGRLEAQRNDIHYAVPDYSIEFTRKDRNLVFSRQVEAGLSFDLSQALAWDPSVLFAAYASRELAQDNPYFTGNMDMGWQVQTAWSFDDLAVTAGIQHSLFDSAEEIPLKTYRQQWGGNLGVGWQIHPQHEVLGQFLLRQAQFRAIGQLSRSSYELHAGYRYRHGDIALEAVLIENIFWVYNSPDWGYTLGLSYAH